MELILKEDELIEAIKGSMISNFEVNNNLSDKKSSSVIPFRTHDTLFWFFRNDTYHPLRDFIGDIPFILITGPENSPNNQVIFYIL